MAKRKPAPVVWTKEELREQRWSVLMNEKWEGKPSGNALHAIECYNTSLEAKPILDMLVTNLGYFGDHYYNPITEPVNMRLDEYYDSVGEEAPSEY